MSASRWGHIYFFLLSAALSLPCLSADRPDEYYDPDVYRLTQGKLFAFGGVGFRNRGATVEEALFGRIVRKPGSIRYMLAVFEHGNDYARCYALVGLRELSPAFYQRALKWFAINGPKTIRTGQGCIIEDAPLEEILHRIDGGLYQEYFRHYERMSQR